MIKSSFVKIALCAAIAWGIVPSLAQGTNRMNADTFEGLSLRSVGPAFLSGRISDLIIHPADESIRYAAAGSGGVWKTENDGITWDPIFDEQGSYSIGTLAIDPMNPHVLWVGTGENNGARHIAYGDGIYRSLDGGKTWQNMGLKESQHISKIIVNPDDSNVIYVAAQGPLWNKGGERGFYKSIDGGETWNKTLGDDEWVGVTDIVMDARDPDLLYAATWQRHRNVAAYMGGGPGSAIHRSDDGGETWEKLSNGLPSGALGKIGLAISYQDPDVLYATIEQNRRQGGFYKSTDRGSSWTRQSDKIAAATGPHYYQEIFTSPHNFDQIFLMDEFVAVSNDGGITFSRLNITHRYGDSHALAFKKSDPNYLFIGEDGGAFESFDNGDHWRYMENLPLAQFYKVALDDAKPFYNIYGGTQDNGSQGGPSRTDSEHGIQSKDWTMVLSWDGHQSATEPGNPDIIYSERQEGALSRIDMTTGEKVGIQPQPDADESFERFNWDAPILVSPHNPTRLYFASHRLWRSDNRGDEWRAISGDLTNISEDRFLLPIMDGQQSWDSSWDFDSMSNYNTITSISESPQIDGLIYIGTDDGLVQVTEDGGANWRAINVGDMPGVPDTAFVNDIKADLHDADTVYVVLDNHKYGDLSPYILKSDNRGRSWKSIRNNLPDRTLVWRIVQDHIKESLMFAATEFGIYFTINSGDDWVKLSGGVPTISFRDLAIQKRENDLVGASFGRGIYILDDYSALRDVSEKALNKEATLFDTRDALRYIPRYESRERLGSHYYSAPNPDFGAVFTYHLRDGLKTQIQTRQTAEQATREGGQDTPFPGWDIIADEMSEADPSIWIIIKDKQGNVVRRVRGPVKQGINRVAWDLRYPAPYALNSNSRLRSPGKEPAGFLAAAGTYSATLVKEVHGEFTTLQEGRKFNVVQMNEGALNGNSNSDTSSFLRSYEAALGHFSAVSNSLEAALSNVEAMKVAASRSQSSTGNIDQRLNGLRESLLKLEDNVFGNRAKRSIGEKIKPNIEGRLFSIELGISESTYGPTATNHKSLKIVNDELQNITARLKALNVDAKLISDDLVKAGAPWVEGSSLDSYIN